MLAERCRASQPAWNGYQEDIKEIGARPVARWHGQPVSLTCRPGEVRLVFSLEAPWDAWECALPVLLKIPRGVWRGMTPTSATAPRRTYIFKRPENSAEPVTALAGNSISPREAAAFSGREGRVACACGIGADDALRTPLRY
jgi:hypothetical protein